MTNDDRTAEQQFVADDGSVAESIRTGRPCRVCSVNHGKSGVPLEDSDAALIAGRVIEQRLAQVEEARKPREAESLEYSAYLAVVAPNAQLPMENPQGRAIRELREAGQSVETRRTLALLRARQGGSR